MRTMRAIGVCCLFCFMTACSSRSVDRGQSNRVWQRTICQAVIEYRDEVGEYPSTLEDLIKNERRPFLASVPDDPWGSPYRYEVIGENPRITSNGPDKKAETPDDIYMDASNQ
jgi:hypothetical protein